MTRAWILPSAVLVLSAAAALVGGRDALSAPDKATFSGDTTHSHVLFKLKHMGVSWSWGRFNDFTVSFDADDAGTTLESVAFNVKAGSVDTGNPKRDQHLKSPDFFNAEQFEDITFKSNSVKASGANAWDVTGDLTLHGVTKPITVKVLKVGSADAGKMGHLIGLESTFVVKRSEYGMDKPVGEGSDEVTLMVAVEGSHK